MRNYIVEKNLMGQDIISYEENGVLFSIPADESNSDYQRYLRWLENPDADETGGIN